MKYSLITLAAAAAVGASPFPQGVTQSIAPTAPPPPGFTTAYSGTFGIAVMNLTAAAQAPVSQSSDGQPAAGTAVTSLRTTVAVTQISDGQIQATPKTTMSPINQISDGQIQNQRPTATPVNQISDGQIQNPRPTATPVNQISDGQIQNPRTTATPVNQISDGQVQNPRTSATPVNQISDGQVQNPRTTATPVNQISDGQIQQPRTTLRTSATPVNQISDGQIQQRPTTSAVRQLSDGQPQVSRTGAVAAAATTAAGGSSGSRYVACKASDSLQITLQNGVLRDSQQRIGYIASNYQFQFDGPPQAGAIYTAGFSVGNNGSLALGGSSIFWQCLSGNFYNLYDRNWAAQCSPINIQVVDLQDC